MECATIEAHYPALSLRETAPELEEKSFFVQAREMAGLSAALVGAPYVRSFFAANEASLRRGGKKKSRYSSEA